MASALLACGRQTAISRLVFHQSTDTPTNAKHSATCRNFTGIVISPRCPHWFLPRLVRWITSQGPHCRRYRWRRVSSRKLKRCLTRLRSLRLQPRSAWEPEMGFTMSRSPLVVFLTTGLHLLTRRNQNWRARLHRTVARCRPTGPRLLWGRHQANTMCLSRRVFHPNRVRTVSWIMEKSGYHPLRRLLRTGAAPPRIGDATRLLLAGETARVQRIPAPRRRKMVSQCTCRIVITELFRHGIQGCCLTGAQQPGAPKKVLWAPKFFQQLPKPLPVGLLTFWLLPFWAPEIFVRQQPWHLACWKPGKCDKDRWSGLPEHLILFRVEWKTRIHLISLHHLDCWN